MPIYKERRLILLSLIIFWVAVILALSGCGPGKIRSTPTPVACVKTADIPAEPEKVKARLNGDWNHDGPIVAVSALDLRDWGQNLVALLRGCY
jgi:hypothetical protein